MLFRSAGNMALNSSAGTISIASDAVNQDINIATAGNRTITCGATGGTTTLVLNSGSGGTALASDGTMDLDSVGAATLNSSTSTVSIANDAIDQNVSIATGGNRVVTVGAIGGTSALAFNSGSGNTAMASDGTTDIDSVGNMALNSSAGTIGIGVDADAFAVNVCTGAAARDLTAGSTNTTSSTTLQAGTGGLSFSAAGIVDVAAATSTAAAATGTVNANVGVSTFTGLTTAAAASQVFTITNSLCTVGSAILCSMSNLGANDAQMCVTRVTPGAGSFTVTCQNFGVAALNGDCILTFWILVA